MRDAVQWLDAANAAGASDYRLHKMSGESRQTVSKICHGVRPLSPALADAIGEALGIHGGVVYSKAQAARAKRTSDRAFWTRMARSIAAGILMAVMGLGPIMAPASAQASAGQVDVRIYIMRNRTRRRWTVGDLTFLFWPVAAGTA